MLRILPALGAEAAADIAGDDMDILLGNFQDILGQDVLEDKAAVDIEFDRADTACKWDLMVTYADDDSKAFWRDIDLCTVSVITIR